MMRRLARGCAIALLLLVASVLAAPAALAQDSAALTVTAPGRTVFAGSPFDVSAAIEPVIGVVERRSATVGQRELLKVTFTVSDGAGTADAYPDANFVWSTKLTIAKPGKYTITATSELPGVKAGTTTVDVAPRLAISLTAPATASAGVPFDVTAAVPGFFPEGPTTMTFTTDAPGSAPVDVDYSVQTKGWTAKLKVAVAGSFTVTAKLGTFTPGTAKVTVLARPEVSLTVSPTRPIIGAAVDVTATVTNGTARGLWQIAVREGPYGERLIADDRPGSSITVKDKSDVRAAHTIVARWLDQGGVFEQQVDVVWMPAITLEALPPQSTVGTPLDLKATVSGVEHVQGGLTMKVTGPGAPSEPLTVIRQGSSFTASYNRGQEAAGHTHTITATWKDYLGEVSATATHVWEAPEIQISVPPGPADLGEEAVVTVSVPVGLGGALHVDVIKGPHKGPLTLTGEAPKREARYKGSLPGPDEIQATVDDSKIGTFRSRVVTRTWNMPTVVLTQQESTSLIGTPAKVTATVKGSTATDVTFRVSGTNAGAAVTVGGAHPESTGTWTGAKGGPDTVQASIVVRGRTYESKVLTHTWVRPTIVINQDTTTSGLGESVQLQAIVTPAAVTGAVTFTVEGVGAPLTFRDDGTDGSWTATYTRTAAGTDTISATLRYGVGSAAVEIPAQPPPLTHVWSVKPPPTVALSPSGTTSCTGVPFTPTASVTKDGKAVAGVPVRLAVTAPSTPALALTATADADGRASFSYLRAAAGTDSLVATAQVDGVTITSTLLTHFWQSCALAVTITPVGTTSAVGSPFKPTVSVRDAKGAPVGGAKVELRATLAGKPDSTFTLTTDANGSATVGYSRTVAGTDRLTAVAKAGERTGQAVVDHFWIVQAGPRIRLSPAGTSSPVGSAFTATALVTDADKPLPGVNVVFRAGLSGQPDVVGTAKTDAAGQASVTFTRKVAGTDSVAAEVVVGDKRVRDVVTHFWTAAARLSMTMGPAGTASPVGTTFTATATALDGGRSIRAGTAVVFRATMDGQPDATVTAASDTAGRATFTFMRSGVGTDQVVATIALPDGRRAEASIQHLWRSTDPTAPVVTPPVSPTVDIRGGAVPGGAVTIIGTGCPPGTTVTISVDGATVATAPVRTDGGYQVTTRVPPLTVGTHTLVGICGAVRANGHLDVVVPTSGNGTAGAAATTVAATFAFFVLLGGQLVRFSGGYPGGS
jgi:hypothetical protein